MGFIYAIMFNNNPVYVGQTIISIQKRWNEHKTLARGNSKSTSFAIHNAMNKYGIDNFSIKLIEETLNDNLNEREKFWIKKLHTHISENGYNLTWGGETCSDNLKITCYQYDLEGNFIQSFNSINEAARLTGNAPNGSNIVKVLKGELNIAYGYRWSYLKQDKLPPLNTNNTGRSKTIYQYDLNGNFIRSYKSTKEAARILDKSQGTISMAANGKRKTAFGYKWSYDYIMEKAGY